MRSMLLEELAGQEEEMQEKVNPFILDTSKQKYKMYILTNQKGINGASCLLYPDVMNKLSEEFQSDFYVFPSSIHELILVPTHDNKSNNEYSNMVREINATQVAREEVLSDHVYYYSRVNGLVMMEC